MTEENTIEKEVIEEEQEQPVVDEATADAEVLVEEEEILSEAHDSAMESVEQELEETRSKLDQMLRIVAEAENSKKRMERDKEKLLKYAGENILRELLSAVDNLDRALEQGRVEGGEPAQKLEALLDGVDLTKKGLHTMLERFEVKPLDSVGLPFNPDEMDALTMEASEEIPANHVLTEFAKGYTFKDRVLRHAQVVVSSGSGEK
ncbi:MAG: nucleotide exchange factor GrpE [Candidatus Electrothrix sp. AR3]|nr:nucleotide exchange factor GrpE [Candidatus Electrothrix sp. AR3]